MEPDAPGLLRDRRQQVVLAVLAGLALLVVGRTMMRSTSGTPMLVTSPAPQTLYVHVAGEVLVPGVYPLPPGSRWADAIRAARGPTLVADLQAVNLAQPARDGERIYVPRLPDPPAPEEEGTHPPTGAAFPRPGGRGSAGLDVNTASAADLEALPGIGKVLAERIVEHRRTHGRFHRLEDLLEVPGLGPRLLERLRPLIQIR